MTFSSTPSGVEKPEFSDPAPSPPGPSLNDDVILPDRSDPYVGIPGLGLQWSMGMRLIDASFPDPHPSTPEIFQQRDGALHMGLTNPPGTETNRATTTTGAGHNLHLNTVVGDTVNNLVMKTSSEDATDDPVMADFTRNASFDTATTANKPNKSANVNTSESTTKGTEGDGHNSNLEEHTSKSISVQVTQTAAVTTTTTTTPTPGGNPSDAIHFSSPPTATRKAPTPNPTPKKAKTPRPRVAVPPMTDEERDHYLGLSRANLEALHKPQIDLIARHTKTYSSAATKKAHIERILGWQTTEKAAARASARAAKRQSEKLHKALFDAFDAVVKPEMSDDEAKSYEESLVQQHSPKLKLSKAATGRKRKAPASPHVTGVEPRVAKKGRTEGRSVGDGAAEAGEGASADVEMVDVEEVEKAEG